ncbi:foldase [Halobacillus fulvus]|nr:foldase [Halobacillus fulvus]
MKKIALTAALAASVFALSACSSNAEDSEVVVETSNGEVTKEEFYEAMKTQSGQQVLQQLVTEEVLAANFEVSDEEVDAELDAMKEQYGDQFESVMEQYNMDSEDEFKELIRKSLVQEKAATEGVEIPEEEIQQYYDRMSTEVRARHILVEDEETAQEVKQKLEDGESFEDLVSEYSTDTGSAQQGGDLDFFGPGVMAEPFEDAAYSLEVGEVSEPVETQFGYHIIEKTDTREAEDVGSYEEEKDNIRRTLAGQQVDQAALQQKVSELMRDAEIDVQIEEFEGMFDYLEQQPASDSEQSDSSNEEDSSSEE